MKNGDTPAMPHTEYDSDGNMPKGLSKREYLAAIAMQGMLSSDVRALPEEFASSSVIMADALLAELKKQK